MMRCWSSMSIRASSPAMTSAETLFNRRTPVGKLLVDVTGLPELEMMVEDALANEEENFEEQLTFNKHFYRVRAQVIRRDGQSVHRFGAARCERTGAPEPRPPRHGGEHLARTAHADCQHPPDHRRAVPRAGETEAQAEHLGAASDCARNRFAAVAGRRNCSTSR